MPVRPLKDKDRSQDAFASHVLPLVGFRNEFWSRMHPAIPDFDGVVGSSIFCTSI